MIKMSPEEIKRAKIEWYSRKECVLDYYYDRVVKPGLTLVALRWEQFFGELK